MYESWCKSVKPKDAVKIKYTTRTQTVSKLKQKQKVFT